MSGRVIISTKATPMYCDLPIFTIEGASLKVRPHLHANTNEAGRG